MSKITDMLVSAVLKKGILYEVNNCDIDVDIPTSQVNDNGEVVTDNIRINIKADHMVLRIEKD